MKVVRHIASVMAMVLIAGLLSLVSSPTNVPQAQAADAGQTICSSPTSEVDIQVGYGTSRIGPGQCKVIGRTQTIYVLGQSMRRRLDTQSTYGKCEPGYWRLDPPGSYKTWFRGHRERNCLVST